MIPVVTLVEPVGEGRRRRLVDDPQHLEPGDAPRVARRGALRVVEVRRHGDDRAIDLRVDFALAGKELLRPALQLAEDEGGNLRRRELACSEPDPDDARRIAANRERKQPRVVADVGEPLPHEALDGVDRAARVGHQPALRFATDVDRPISRHRDNRRDEPIARPIPNDERHAVLHVRHQAVGRAEVDADDFAHKAQELTTWHAEVLPSVSLRQLPFNPREQIVDVVPLQHPRMERFERRAAFPRRRAAVDERVPLRRQGRQLLLVLGALGLDRPGGAFQLLLQFAGGAPAVRRSRTSSSSSLRAKTSSSSAGGTSLLASSGPRAAEPFELQEVLDPRNRLPKRAIRVVQVRAALETGQALGRRRIVEKIRMKLAAERSESPLQIGHVEVQFSRQTEEGEIVAVAAERQNLRALRAEVRVNRRASPASLAGLKSWS